MLEILKKILEVIKRREFNLQVVLVLSSERERISNL